MTSLFFFIIIGTLLGSANGETVCSTEEASIIARSFIHQYKDNSSCPVPHWLHHLVESEDNARSNTKVLFNVGFNKGYNFIEWLYAWTGNTALSKWEWFISLKRAGARFACGHCLDCRESPLKFIKKLPSVPTMMHGADLNPQPVKIVTDASKDLRSRLGLSDLNITVQNAGLSNVTGNFMLTGCSHNFEGCSLRSGGTNGIAVPITTLDEFSSSLVLKYPLMRAQNIPPYMVDVFQIDAEGHDFLIIQSGERFLSQQLARILIFEVKVTFMFKI